MNLFGHRAHVLVIGAGRSGLASARVLRGRGARVTMTDERAPHALSREREALQSIGAGFAEPGTLPALLRGFTAAVLSPGVPRSGALVRLIDAAGVEIIGEVELAYRICRAPIVAITGTKGKSTTTALTGHLLACAGINARVGGNIGDPLVEQVLDAAPGGVVVAELSSFQLESIATFKPAVSVLLNISEDHLDRYPSIDAYARAKFRIFENQSAAETFIGSLDDERIAALRDPVASGLRAAARWFTLRDLPGASLRLRAGELRYAAPDGSETTIAQRSQIPLAGDHNVQNVMAAVLAAICAGADPAALRGGIETFRPPAHRLSPIAEIDGVLYVDDSKATNPLAVTAALAAYDRPIVLIAGGRAKGTDFAELGRVIDRRAKALVAIGEAAEELAACVSGVPVHRARTLLEAIATARAQARSGDVVLLSPACASFDMFDSAEDRGEQFVAGVQALRETAAR